MINNWSSKVDVKVMQYLLSKVRSVHFGAPRVSLIVLICLLVFALPISAHAETDSTLARRLLCPDTITVTRLGDSFVTLAVFSDSINYLSRFYTLREDIVLFKCWLGTLNEEGTPFYAFIDDSVSFMRSYESDRALASTLDSRILIVRFNGTYLQHDEMLNLRNWFEVGHDDRLLSFDFNKDDWAFEYADKIVVVHDGEILQIEKATINLESDASTDCTLVDGYNTPTHFPKLHGEDLFVVNANTLYRFSLPDLDYVCYPLSIDLEPHTVFCRNGQFFVSGEKVVGLGTLETSLSLEDTQLNNVLWSCNIATGEVVIEQLLPNESIYRTILGELEDSFVLLEEGQWGDLWFPFYFVVLLDKVDFNVTGLETFADRNDV